MKGSLLSVDGSVGVLRSVPGIHQHLADEVGLRCIRPMADRLDHDQERRALLRTIARDERSTLYFFADARDLLSSS